MRFKCVQNPAKPQERRRAYSCLLVLLACQLGSTRSAPKCPAPPGSIYKCCLEFLLRQTRLILLQEQKAELLSGGNDWSGCYWQFLDSVLLICGRAHQGHGFTWFLIRLGRPGHHFMRENAHLSRPIIIAGLMKLILDL